MDHGLRRSRALEAVSALGLDALLVTNLPNVRYLTGFSGSSAQLILGAAPVLLVDGRYAAQAAREAADIDRRTCLGGYLEVAVEVAARSGRRIGFEREALTVGGWERMREADSRMELTPTDGIVEQLREVKDDEERALMATAQEAADAAFDAVILGGGLREAVSEREVAFELEIAMRRAGADAPAFDPIVAFGENAAEPHHEPSGRVLRRGDMVTMDFGAQVDGYRSDMTRTIAFGEPAERHRELYDLVATAQAAGAATVRDGVVASEVDAAARRVIDAAGLAEAFSHPVGHAVGLEIHESPIMRSTCGAVLRTGAVVTVEPGVYLPGVGGVRIEDMLEVTPDGRRVLPRTRKELIVL